jgi:predicted transcriptional regulator
MEDHDQPASEQSLATLTAEIVSAYVSNNTISTSQIGELIGDVSRQLHGLGQPQEQEPTKPEPAVSVRRSIGSDHLICLVCGKKQRMLKRHLASEHQLTPDEYRKLFELKLDYPMVAPSYAAMRRDLALKIGLGRPKKQTPVKRAAAKKTEAPKTKGTAKRAASNKAETPAKARRSRARAA